MRFLKDAGWRADHTDALARRYLDAGFVCVGRTNTPELGLVPTTEPEAYGPTRNPWDTTRTTGGSSGGSAAAVASGMVAVAHANDGGGSIRIPGELLRPRRAEAVARPHVARPRLHRDRRHARRRALRVAHRCATPRACSTCCTAAPHGETVTAPAPARPFTREVGADPGKLRIALLTHNPLETGEIHPDCVAAARDTAQLLESLGHTVEETYPGRVARPELVGHFTTLWTATLALQRALLGAEGRPRGTADDVEPLTWTMAEMGRAVSAVRLHRRAARAGRPHA